MSVISDTKVGLMAPINALFFLKSKIWLFICSLFIHICAFSAYIYAVHLYATPFVGQFITKTISLNLAGILLNFFGFIISFSIFIIAFILYAIIFVPIVNVIASPFFDLIATKAYLSIKSEELPSASIKIIIKNSFFELLKVLFLIALFALTAFSNVFFLLTPICLILLLWFSGWDYLDRTLIIKNFSIMQRIKFGFRHFFACLALGIWCYIPFIGSLFSFVMAAAGAIAVAKIEQK